MPCEEFLISDETPFLRCPETHTVRALTAREDRPPLVKTAKLEPVSPPVEILDRIIDFVVWGLMERGEPERAFVVMRVNRRTLKRWARRWCDKVGEKWKIPRLFQARMVGKALDMIATIDMLQDEAWEEVEQLANPWERSWRSEYPCLQLQANTACGGETAGPLDMIVDTGLNWEWDVWNADQAQVEGHRAFKMVKVGYRVRDWIMLDMDTDKAEKGVYMVRQRSPVIFLQVAPTYSWVSHTAKVCEPVDVKGKWREWQIFGTWLEHVSGAKVYMRTGQKDWKDVWERICL